MDGRTYITKLMVAFRKFGKEPKKGFRNTLVLLFGIDACAPEAYE
jgi:hypothetical protein